MDEYEPLAAFLGHQLADRVEYSRDQIEDADRIGIELPLTAKQFPDWWEKDPQLNFVLRKVGWRVQSADTEGELIVTFVGVKPE